MQIIRALRIIPKKNPKILSTVLTVLFSLAFLQILETINSVSVIKIKDAAKAIRVDQKFEYALDKTCDKFKSGLFWTVSGGMFKNHFVNVFVKPDKLLVFIALSINVLRLEASIEEKAVLKFANPANLET